LSFIITLYLLHCTYIVDKRSDIMIYNDKYEYTVVNVCDWTRARGREKICIPTTVNGDGGREKIAHTTCIKHIQTDVL
jgi:hypothetical protein